MQSGGSSAIGTIIYLIIIVAMIAGMWKVFVKAGQPGWAAIVPIYNLYVLTQIVGKPILWFILMFVPLVNLVIMIMISMELAVCFGKSKGWGFLFLVILGFVGYPMLGFGDAAYTKPAAAA